MLLLALAAAAASPQPGVLKTFGDWIVGCDNGRACQAVALIPEAAERESYLMLVITRDGAARAGATLLVPGAEGVEAGTRLTLLVDGKPIAQLGSPSSDAQARLPIAATWSKRSSTVPRCRSSDRAASASPPPRSRVSRHR